MHGPKCKTGASCTVGRRVQLLHILAGLIFPIWGTIEHALSSQERAIHRRLRVYRLETSGADPKRIVGVHIPAPALDAVMEGEGVLCSLLT